MTGFEPGISCTEATAIPTVPQPLPYVLLLTVYVEKEAVGSVTRSGDLLDFGQLLNAFGNT